MTKGVHMRAGEGTWSQVCPRLSLALNVLMALAIAAACVWKFTGVRYAVQEIGGGASYEDNQWWDSYVQQARELCAWSGSDVVMAGDSLTMYGLWDEFFEGVEVTNRGVGSDVAEGLLARVDTIVQERPSKVFVMIGTNDVSRGHNNAETAAYVREALESIHEGLPDADIYLQSVLPRTSKYVNEIEELNGLYERMCSELGWVGWVDLYPFYCEEGGTPKAGLFAIEDGYHLSGEGYALWVEQIRPLVEG